jgi:hypothetical protein
MDKAIENVQINEYNNRKIVISTKQGTPFRVQFPRMGYPGSHLRLAQLNSI